MKKNSEPDEIFNILEKIASIISLKKELFNRLDAMGSK